MERWQLAVLWFGGTGYVLMFAWGLVTLVDKVKSKIQGVVNRRIPPQVEVYKKKKGAPKKVSA